MFLFIIQFLGETKRGWLQVWELSLFGLCKRYFSQTFEVTSTIIVVTQSRFVTNSPFVTGSSIGTESRFATESHFVTGSPIHKGSSILTGSQFSTEPKIATNWRENFSFELQLCRIPQAITIGGQWWNSFHSWLNNFNNWSSWFTLPKMWLQMSREKRIRDPLQGIPRRQDCGGQESGQGVSLSVLSF